MKAKLCIAGLSALLLLFACSSEQTTDKTIPNLDNQIITEDSLAVKKETLHSNVTEQSAAVESQLENELAQEAVTALEETQKAVSALDQNKRKEAYKHLEAALGKLEALFARQPNLKVVPVDVKVEVIDLNADIKTINATRRSVKQFIKEGKYQTARTLLENLVDEIRISIYQLPMATYPEAIKVAIKYLDQGKSVQAKNLLDNTLKTLVVTESAIPIPVINAQLMADIAADSVEQNDKLSIQLLQQAQGELKLAEALGYGDRDHEFIEIHKDIENLLKKIRKKENSAEPFDSLKARIKKFKERIS